MKTLPFLLLLANFVIGQTSLRIGIGGGYIQPNKVNLAFHHPESQRKFSLSSTYEALVEQTLNKHWHILAGLQYERLSFKFNDIPIFDRNLLSSFAPVEKIGDLTQVMHYVNVPLYLHYYFGNKKNVFIGVSLAQRYFVQLNNKETFINNNGGEMFQISSFTAPMVNFSAGMEVGYNIKWHKKYISLHAFYKSIIGNSPQINAQLLHYFGFMMGIKINNLLGTPRDPGALDGKNPQ